MNKRIMALFLCVIMIFAMPTVSNSLALQATEIKVIPDKTAAAPGDTLTYSIVFGAVSELGSMQMSLDIPNGLTYVAGSFAFENNIKQTLGFDNIYWTENILLINGVASAGDYSSSADTNIATFKCKINSSFTGTLQTGLKNLEFASCVTNQLTTSRFSVVKTAVTVKKAQERINFPDVNYKDWYGDAVEYAVGAGLMKGYANGKFGTSDGIQRQDFVVILSRLSGDDISKYEGKASFKDVPTNAYYAAALAWAKAVGVSNGYADGNFGVGNKVTREQIMTFLRNYAILKDYEIIVTETESSIRSKFSDYSTVSGYARPSVIWAISNGVVGGKNINGKKYISPQANAQRCEVAGMFYNIYKNDIFKKN
ncbi:MAG: S-layer homology domain-containing protein [Clostridia bacterium]|nr:S-layer homology domain-containing protein [Clostridia bacterium]